MKIRLKESLLYRTGQAWKFWVQVYGGLFLALLTVMAYWHGDITPGSFSMLLLWIGISVFGVSMIFAYISIKCPVCGTKWFWLAVSKKHEIGGIDWFLSLSKCPVCGYSGEDGTQQKLH